MNNSVDKAIVFNNIARLYLCVNEQSAALKANKLCFENISIEATNILKERLINPNYYLLVENQSKFELISFLFYNNAFLFEKAKLEEESNLIYRKGYEFSLSTLGDLNILTNKFKPKLNLPKRIPKSLNNFNDVRKKTLDSKYDSDIDYLSVLDSHMAGFSNLMPKMRQNKKPNTKERNIPPIPIVKIEFLKFLFSEQRKKRKFNG